MTITFRSIATAATAALFLHLAVVAPRAAAQAHIQAAEDHILRASTVSASNLSDEMRNEYGIPLAANTAVLNVTVQRKTDGAPRNVPARLEVQARNLYGMETGVEMRKVVANGLVSYLGTYEFLPRETLDFRITAHPEGTQQSVTLEFRDRLGHR
jgi:hypothetical protein